MRVLWRWILGSRLLFGGRRSRGGRDLLDINISLKTSFLKTRERERGNELTAHAINYNQKVVVHIRK